MFELWKLKRAGRKARSTYGKTFKKHQADKTKGPDDFNSLLADCVHEEQMIDQAAQSLSQRITQDAEEYDVEIRQPFTVHTLSKLSRTVNTVFYRLRREQC
jgi:hypothetical protein